MRSQWAARILAQKGTSYYLRSSSFEEDGDDNHEGTGAAAGPKKKKAPRQSQIIDDTVKRNNLALCTSYVKYIASRRGTHAFARGQRIITSLVQTQTCPRPRRHRASRGSPWCVRRSTSARRLALVET